MNQKDGSNSEWENMEILERKEPIVLMAIWKSVEQKQHLLLAYWTVREEYRRMGRAREEGLRKVRYKP